MKPHFRLLALTRYPKWHNKPFRLSSSEVQNPYLVLYNFFDIYDLAGFRDEIKNIQEDLLYSEEPDLKSHLYTMNNMERLAEAAWILHRKHQRKKENKILAELDRTQPFESPTDDQVELADTSLRLIDLTSHAPLETLHKVFVLCHFSDLKEALSEWQNLALIHTADHFNTVQQKAALIGFCTSFRVLIEAAFVKTKKEDLTTRAGFEITRPTGLFKDLMLQEGVSLNSEELNTPEKLFATFFETRSLLHARSILWNMLDLVVQQNEDDQSQTVKTYERFQVIIDASWYLLKQYETEKPLDENE